MVVDGGGQARLVSFSSSPQSLSLSRYKTKPKGFCLIFAHGPPKANVIYFWVLGLAFHVFTAIESCHVSSLTIKQTMDIYP